MNERSLKVLEQYDLEVKSIRRGRDSYVMDTSQGIILLKEYYGSKRRAQWIEKVCRKVNEGGMCADIPIADKNGDYVSCDKEENRYMLKRWTSGREMDVNNFTEINEAVVNLARLHRILTGFDDGAGPEKVSLEQLFEKRIRELRKIWHYIKEKKRKNIFELSFIREYNAYIEMCQKALELSGQAVIQEVRQHALEKGAVCHGDYNQHNILKDKNTIVTVNFENCMVGVQTDDLYCFMRKMLEKHNWKIELADRMLKAYLEQCELSNSDLEELYIKFLFPEKFWKIANHYYNSKKTWIPDRSLQKLDKIIAQAQSRKAFLDYFKSTYISR